jgi:hypothetical protein
VNVAFVHAAPANRGRSLLTTGAINKVEALLFPSLIALDTFSLHSSPKRWVAVTEAVHFALNATGDEAGGWGWQRLRRGW